MFLICPLSVVFCPFYVVTPVKQGKRVTSVRVGWLRKDSAALHEAFAESQRPRFGRRARIAGTVEHEGIASVVR